MKLIDENVARVRKVREKLIAKYGGLDGWIRHLQAMERKRAKEKAKRAAARRSARTARPKTKGSKPKRKRKG